MEYRVLQTKHAFSDQQIYNFNLFCWISQVMADLFSFFFSYAGRPFNSGKVMQPADEMKQPAVTFDDRFVNKLKQLRLDFVLENSVLFTIRT